jgi:CBS domain containing-hemolysin-like protein
LQNLFRLRSLTAHDIMTPRPVMVALPQAMTVGEALEQHPQLPVSRIPVYEENIDQIVGFVLKTEILLKQASDLAQTPLADIVREVKVVAADATLIELLDILLQELGHLAIVTDEFGGTDGLVTMEDLIETLLGIEIVDEADTAADMQRLAREQWQRRVEALGLEVHPIVPPADEAEQ